MPQSQHTLTNRGAFEAYTALQMFTERVPEIYMETLHYIGTREITRLEIMAYLEPASNSGSKPQSLSDKKM